MSTPTPGKPVRGSQTGRPIMALLDQLGRRWTLRILWELREESLTFRELQSRCERMSPSVLNRRLAELKEGDIVRVGDGGYGVTERGAELLQLLGPLDAWAAQWARRTARQGG